MRQYTAALTVIPLSWGSEEYRERIRSEERERENREHIQGLAQQATYGAVGDVRGMLPIGTPAVPISEGRAGDWARHPG